MHRLLTLAALAQPPPPTDQDPDAWGFVRGFLSSILLIISPLPPPSFKLSFISSSLLYLFLLLLSKHHNSSSQLLFLPLLHPNSSPQSSLNNFLFWINVLLLYTPMLLWLHPLPIDSTFTPPIPLNHGLYGAWLLIRFPFLPPASSVSFSYASLFFLLPL